MAERPQNSTPSENLPLRKRLERSVGNFLIPCVILPLRYSPWGLARLFGKGLGTLLYHTLKRYRKVAHKNLTLIYSSEKSPHEIAQMAKAVYQHFGQLATEFIKLPTLDRSAVDKIVTVEGEENLKQALAEGRGVLIMTGHFGNWEMLARWFTTHGYTLNVVARDARVKNASKMLEETRRGSGANVLLRGNSARGVLQHLKMNELIGILPDQNAIDVFVPFFGFPTGTVDGPAIFHLKTQAPLVFSWCVRTPDNRYHITFEPPVVHLPSGDKPKDVETIMTLVNAHLEAQIRKHPTQWLWLHDRWKASPGVFPEGEANMLELKNARIKTKETTQESRK